MSLSNASKVPRTAEVVKLRTVEQRAEEARQKLAKLVDEAVSSDYVSSSPVVGVLSAASNYYNSGVVDPKTEALLTQAEEGFDARVVEQEMRYGETVKTHPLMEAAEVLRSMRRAVDTTFDSTSFKLLDEEGDMEPKE